MVLKICQNRFKERIYIQYCILSLHKTILKRIVFIQKNNSFLFPPHKLILTWWALHIRSRSCLCRNLATISAPNVKETPRSFSPQPMVSLSGSDHRRSHSKPWSGTSVGLMIRRICSIDCRSGLKPEQQQIHISFLHLKYMWSLSTYPVKGLRELLAISF